MVEIRVVEAGEKTFVHLESIGIEMHCHLDPLEDGHLVSGDLFEIALGKGGESEGHQGFRTALMYSPRSIFSKQLSHSPSPATRLMTGSRSSCLESIIEMTRSQIGQLCEKLPESVMFFCTRGSRLNCSGCGPQPILMICPAGRTACSAICRVADAPEASIATSTPRPSPSLAMRSTTPPSSVTSAQNPRATSRR